MYSALKKIIFFFLFYFFFTLSLAAQQNHFIYLQTENKLPFYVKFNKKIWSSATEGYLIIPKLQQGSYLLTIGFVKNEWPEQMVTCVINDNDQGYLLKIFNDKGWGLFNLQTMEVAMATEKKDEDEKLTEVIAAKPEIKPIDTVIAMVVPKPFSSDNIKEIQIAKDTTKEIPIATDTIMQMPITKDSVKEIPIAKPVEKIEPTTPPIITNEQDKPVAAIIKKQDSTIVTKQETVPAIKELPPKPIITIIDKKDSAATKKVKAQPVVVIINKKKPASPASTIHKLFTTKNADGMEMIYIDKQNNKTDTIRVYLPATSSISNKIIAQPIKTATTTNKSISDIKITTKANVANTVRVDAHCKNIATAADFFKIKKKMSLKISDDDKITSAKLFFKVKCFTTDQIKNLSTMFLSNEGKYKFFDAAYAYVSDTNNFTSLQAQLTDQYYITRFKAMIHN